MVAATGKVVEQGEGSRRKIGRRACRGQCFVPERWGGQAREMAWRQKTDSI